MGTRSINAGSDGGAGYMQMCNAGVPFCKAALLHGFCWCDARVHTGMTEQVITISTLFSEACASTDTHTHKKGSHPLQLDHIWLAFTPKSCVPVLAVTDVTV